MKFRKLLVLALVLALFVCAFAACGDGTDTETNLPETDSETEAPASDTEDPGKETEEPGECTHELEVEEKLATCTDGGYKKETCKLCGEVVSETGYPKAAHTPVAAATCTEDSKCSVCNEVIEAAKGHTFGEAVVVDATCLAEGSKTQTCSTCNEKVVKTLPALAHNIPDANVTASVAATCTTDGSKTGTCTLCNRVQTVVLPGTHSVSGLGDLSALTFADGKIQAKCSTCNIVVDVTGDLRLALNFDEADIETEIANLATEKNGLAYTVLHLSDPKSALVAPPCIATYPDAVDGHTSVMSVPNNRSAAIWFDGALLSDADYYVISFDWRITATGSSSNKIGVFGPSNAHRSEAVVDSDFAYALRVDRSNGELANNSKQAINLVATPGQWYEVIVVVDNELGIAYTYIDGTCYSVLENAKYLVTENGEYTWRFGGVYNVIHQPEFDDFSVVAIVASEPANTGDGEGGEDLSDPEDDGSGCDHQTWTEVQYPTVDEPGYIKRTCSICNRVVYYEILLHVHTPDAPADCEHTSVCLSCGIPLEQAWGHSMDPEVPVVETPADPACSAPGTRTGKCITCGQDVVEDMEPADHTFDGAALDLDAITFDADGNIMAPCSVCGTIAAVTSTEKFALTFDTFAPDFIIDGANSLKSKVVNGRLYMPGNYGPCYTFDASLLDATDIYVISFDYRRVSTNDKAKDKYGVFGLARIDAAGNIADQHNYALKIERGTFNYTSGGVPTGGVDKTVGDIPATPVVATNDANALDKITIVVDNGSGYSYVYINGSFYVANETDNMLVSTEDCGEGYSYAWRFGGRYGVNIENEWDNFKVVALNVACGHAATEEVERLPATCTAPGEADLICEKCGADVGDKEIPVVDHAPNTADLKEDLGCAYLYGCNDFATCGTTITVEKEGATHTVAVPTAFDSTTVIKDGKIQGLCSVCGLSAEAPITEDIRLALNFDQTDLATEVAAQNAANANLGLTVENDSSYPVESGAIKAVDGAAGKTPLYIGYNGEALSDAAYYMISIDWKWTVKQTGGLINVFGACDADKGSLASVAYYDRSDSKLVDKENANDHTHLYPAGEGLLEKDAWYTFNVIVDNATGTAYVFVNGTYIQTVVSDNFKITDGNTYFWRLNNKGAISHVPYWDNFKVEVLAKAAVTE